MKSALRGAFFVFSPQVGMNFVPEQMQAAWLLYAQRQISLHVVCSRSAFRYRKPLVSVDCVVGRSAVPMVKKMSFMKKNASKSKAPTVAQAPTLEIVISEAAGFAGVGDVASNSAKAALKALGSLVSEAVAPLREQLSGSELAADEIEISLSLACQAGGKWVVVETTAQATIGLKLVWKKAVVANTVAAAGTGTSHV